MPKSGKPAPKPAPRPDSPLDADPETRSDDQAAASDPSRQQPSAPADTREVVWIQDTETLRAFCQTARLERVVAIDTEFHRERTYYARLALVQLATFRQIACVDPLAPGMDLSPLDELVLDPQVLKILHAGRQDLEIFVERTGQVPSPFFDTQIAAALLGLGEQIGYGPLVQKVCGVPLGKTQVRTDWMHRPLDADVVRYAADDVRYLAALYKNLNDDLLRRGRREWLNEEQRTLSDLNTYKTDPQAAWEKVKGTDKLKGVGCAIAQRITAWRETTAQELDRPRRRVLPDEIILDLARQRPRTEAPLERMRGLDPGIRKKYGARLIELVLESEKMPRDQWPDGRKRGVAREVDDALVMALAVVLQIQARRADISQAMLSSRAELADVVAGIRDVPVLNGWRRELAGEAMLDFLQGRSRLRAEKGKLILEPAGA